MFSFTQSVKPPWQSCVFNLYPLLLFSFAKQQPKGNKWTEPTSRFPTVTPKLQLVLCKIVLNHNRTKCLDVAEPQLLLSFWVFPILESGRPGGASWPASWIQSCLLGLKWSYWTCCLSITMRPKFFLKTYKKIGQGQSHSVLFNQGTIFN